MANFSAPVPTESEKSAYLHERANRPAPPKRSNFGLVRSYLGAGLGVLFAIGFVALAFQIRAGWDNHREWVVAITVPGLVLGGVAFGHLIARRQLTALAPGAGLLVLTLVLVFLNYLRGRDTTGEDGLRDALSIISGVSLVLTVSALVGALAWVEWKRPTKAPLPEV
jgi:peptidoglycan/LPS O-acetylase OafA/YrhL